MKRGKKGGESTWTSVDSISLTYMFTYYAQIIYLPLGQFNETLKEETI